MSNNVPYGPNGGTPQKVAAWCLNPRAAAACQRGDMVVPTVTVAIHADLFNDADENAAIDLSDVFFRVTWSSSNTSCGTDCQSVDIDAINGSSGSLQAQALEVLLMYPGAVGVARPTLQVNVSVGVGTSGKAGQGASWQRTIKVAASLLQPPATPFVIQKIPDWAIAARYINALIATPTIELRQLQAANGALVSAATIGKGCDDCVPIARGLGARWFTLQAAAFVEAAAVQFDLCPN